MSFKSHYFNICNDLKCIKYDYTSATLGCHFAYISLVKEKNPTSIQLPQKKLKHSCESCMLVYVGRFYVVLKYNNPGKRTQTPPPN